MEFDVVHIETVDSTNTHILGLIESNGCQEGLVIRADEQLAGRGHGENNWESEKGKNLLFSLVLRSVFIKPADQFIIQKSSRLPFSTFLKKISRQIILPLNGRMIFILVKRKLRAY